MITSRKKILTILLFISCSIHAITQTDYYYYQGKKVPLTLNENKVCVSIPKEYNNISERIRSNAVVLGKINDEKYDILIITQSDYEKITSMDFWKEDAKSVIVTSSYFTEENIEVFATPYLNVRLKDGQDTDMLNPYVEDYKLIMTGKSKYLPWYILSITPDSKKNSVECANELYETGDFASSVPDFVSDDLLDKTTSVPGITSATTTESTGIYDLQGRRLSGKPARGIYIENGKKIAIK